MNFKRHLWWGNSHPSEYVTKNAEGKPCGVGVSYQKQQQDAVFNIWLWLVNFKTPEQMKKVAVNKQVSLWVQALSYVNMYHKGVEIGVEALRLAPAEFLSYAEGSSLERPREKMEAAFAG